MDQVPRKQETAFFLAEAAEAEDSLKRIPNQRRGGQVRQQTRMLQSPGGTTTSSPIVALLGKQLETHLIDAKAKHRTTQKMVLDRRFSAGEKRGLKHRRPEQVLTKITRVIMQVG